MFHIPVLLFRFDAPFGWKTCALLCKGHQTKAKCEGENFFNRLLRGLWLWKKSKTTLPGIVLTHHLVIRVYFVILTNLKILQNFALHGENWKMKILKNQIIHQIKRVSYCKWNFKGFKILTNFKAWADLILFDFWKWKKYFFSQTVHQTEKVSAGYETKLLILDMKSALFFRYNGPLRF